MPASASMPTHSCSTARATRSSQDSPAATVTSAPPQVGSSPSMSARTPRVATSTTVPSKPTSATTTLLPPPSTRSGPSMLIASTSSCSVVARTHALAGPPSRSVVCSGQQLCHLRGTDDGLGHAEHLLPARGHRQRDRGQAVLRLLGLASISTSTPPSAGYDDRRGELAAERDHLGAREPVRDGPRRQRHGVHAVRDDAGQPDAARHLARPGGSGCGRRSPRRTPPGRRA